MNVYALKVSNDLEYEDYDSATILIAANSEEDARAVWDNTTDNDKHTYHYLEEVSHLKSVKSVNVNDPKIIERLY